MHALWRLLIRLLRVWFEEVLRDDPDDQPRL